MAADLRRIDADLAALSRRLAKAEAQGQYELAAVLAKDLDALLTERYEAAAEDDCTR